MDKGQIGGGILIAVFVGVLVALVLFQSSAQFIGQATTSATVTNRSVTLPANGACSEISGWQNLLSSTYQIINASTAGTLWDTTNVTLQEKVGTDGLLSVHICTLDPNVASKGANVTATIGPDGYINNAGGRSIASIIVLLAAIAIAIAALIPIGRNKDWW